MRWLELRRREGATGALAGCQLPISVPNGQRGMSSASGLAAPHDHRFGAARFLDASTTVLSTRSRAEPLHPARTQYSAAGVGGAYPISCRRQNAVNAVYDNLAPPASSSSWTRTRFPSHCSKSSRICWRSAHCSMAAALLNDIDYESSSERLHALSGLDLEAFIRAAGA